MAGPLAVAGLTAGASILGSYINSNQSRRNVLDTNRGNIALTEQQLENNLQLADHQFSKNLEMWNIQNAYNSPESQMARYKQAGLNPALMYGQGTSGNAQQMPQYQSPHSERALVDYRGKQAFNPMQSLFDYQQSRANEANLKILQGQRDKIDVEILGIQSQNALKQVELAIANATKRDKINISHMKKAGEALKLSLQETGTENASSTLRAMTHQLKQMGLTQGEVRTAIMAMGLGTELLKAMGFGAILKSIFRATGGKIPQKNQLGKTTIDRGTHVGPFKGN